MKWICRHEGNYEDGHSEDQVLAKFAFFGRYMFAEDKNAWPEWVLCIIKDVQHCYLINRCRSYILDTDSFFPATHRHTTQTKKEEKGIMSAHTKQVETHLGYKR